MIARIVAFALLLLTVAGLGRATLYYREQYTAANSLAAARRHLSSLCHPRRQHG